METDAKPRIRQGRTEMDFPHQGKILTAVHPFYGPANSLTLLKQIGGSLGTPTYLRVPTSAELTSFVHEYFGGAELHAQEVTRIVKDNYFRGFTGILTDPQKRIAHFIDYPEFDENSRVNRDNLLNRLAESRAQVDFEYLKGSVNIGKLAKHPYFVAWAGGEEGAEKLAELASKFPRNQVYIGFLNLKDLKEPKATVASLCLNWGDGRLVVNSCGSGGNPDSVSFGIWT
ncbi:MAG: hypothetical protein NTW17_02605 [Candidatus Pacearchaeota archaeon]|nr:hypothetical protein [Candidatus Pacearchaeota archaeon]